jgi:hypothetical protein
VVVTETEEEIELMDDEDEGSQGEHVEDQMDVDEGAGAKPLYQKVSQDRKSRPSGQTQDQVAKVLKPPVNAGAEMLIPVVKQPGEEPTWCLN